ncbi:MAG: AsmA family protein [Candidatus Omnitrophica bacterium]|nr:AsmA family protein [Candidatus Omnitrophota bacterium]
MVKKAFNIKGIIKLAIILIVLQVVFGLIISPLVSSFIIDKLNEVVGTKITCDKLSVWPLTLSCSLKNLKIFDPDNEKERILAINMASIRISPFALLSKRLVFSKISVSGADINLIGEPDGTFNVQKLAQGSSAREEAKRVTPRSLLDRFKAKKDWYTRIYNMLKNKSSKQSIEKRQQEKEASKKIEKDVVSLPKGRRVSFNRERDRYIFEIQHLNIKNSRLHMEANNGSIVIENTAIGISGITLDPSKGARVDKCNLKGNITKNGTQAGNFEFLYAQRLKNDKQIIDCNLSAKNVDLKAVGFLFEDSLPVGFTKGKINLESKTRIINNELDSRNSLVIRDQVFVPKQGKNISVNLIPLPVLCAASNEIDPIRLKFSITGTLEKPQLSGFIASLMVIVKPYVAIVAERLKKEGIKAITTALKAKEGTDSSEEAGQKALDAFKSFLGNKEE